MALWLFLGYEKNLKFFSQPLLKVKVRSVATFHHITILNPQKYFSISEITLPVSCFLYSFMFQLIVFPTLAVEILFHQGAVFLLAGVLAETQSRILFSCICTEHKVESLELQICATAKFVIFLSDLFKMAIF